MVTLRSATAVPTAVVAASTNWPEYPTLWRTLLDEVWAFVRAEKLDAATRDRLNAAIDGGKKALRSGDPGEIQKALEELTQAYSAAGSSLTQAAQQSGAGAGASQGGTPPGGDGATGGEQKKEDVVEADYEIVDESKSGS